jgi:hypothetical protein
MFAGLVSAGSSWLRPLDTWGVPFDASDMEVKNAPGDSSNRAWWKLTQGPCGVLEPAGHTDRNDSDNQRADDDRGDDEQQGDDHA